MSDLIGKGVVIYKDILHYTKANTYEFQKGQKKLHFAPLEEEDDFPKASNITAFWPPISFETEIQVDHFPKKTPNTFENLVEIKWNHESVLC